MINIDALSSPEAVEARVIYVVGEGDLRVLQTQPQPIGAVADAEGRLRS
jgi:hypothetical protein